MPRVVRHPLLVLAFACCLHGVSLAQSQRPPTPPPAPVSPAPPQASATLPPLKDPATVDQIREYLRLSGDLESYRARWIAAVDKNRSIGSPYWPESFWTDLKAEMGKTDLMPMFVTLYQHTVSRELMQDALDTYHRWGAVLFKISPAAIRLGAAHAAMSDDNDKLTLANTLEITRRVYALHKPEIKAARVRYLAEHPGFVDK